MRDEVIFTADGRINTKKERSKDCRKPAYASGVPSSYKSNTTREELCLEYIQSFLKQYQSLYPKRKQPYMIIDNEHGLQKFICSAIRPSHMPFSELYDMYECSAFLAGYILYEPLDPPSKPPRIIFSPTETLKRHTGDCFDMSTLLCSLLIGSGYDAYIVCGYAPRHITLRDQSNTLCPMANTLYDISAKAKLKNEEVEQSETEESAYVPLDNSVKSSHYIAHQLERQRVETLDLFELWITDPPPSSTVNDRDNDDDQAEGLRRQHAWVMVCAGRREVKETIFLEPSTGRVFATNGSPYTAVDSVWNHSNFWALHNSEAKVSDVSSKGRSSGFCATEKNFTLSDHSKLSHLFCILIIQINFDLSRSDNWESLFPYGAQRTDGGEAFLSPIGDGRRESMMEKKRERLASGAGQAAEVAVEVVEIDGAVSRTFENPPSWVSPILLDRTQYVIRYPPYGRRTVQYYCAKADFFARNVHPQVGTLHILPLLRFFTTFSLSPPPAIFPPVSSLICWLSGLSCSHFRYTSTWQKAKHLIILLPFE
jgi:hypothetical protein